LRYATKRKKYSMKPDLKFELSSVKTPPPQARCATRRYENGVGAGN
jgi:hypothetical protein